MFEQESQNPECILVITRIQFAIANAFGEPGQKGLVIASLEKEPCATLTSNLSQFTILIGA